MYRAAPGGVRAGKEEKEASKEEGTIVRTSPAKPAAAEKAPSPSPPAKQAGPVAGRSMKEGITRDTRSSSQPALFGGGGDGGGAGMAGLDLAQLEKMVAGCTRCGLHETRTNTVFADGNASAGLVFIGEAPGKDEDLQGLPFVGRAGKLLDKMIDAIGFSRKNVYIANILKCRPPGNRDQKEDEVSACERYLARQIELIEPAVICALGRIAGQNLLGTRAPLRVLREGIHSYNGIPVIVTYHPAALLRNPNWKQDAWEDLKMLRSLHGELTGDGGGREE